MQLMSGGTMGVVYGAAGLWQWKVTPAEEGWGPWATQPLYWEQALRLEGSNYVGHVAKAFAGMPFADMEKRPDLTAEGRPLLAVAGKFYISYLNEGGAITFKDLPAGLPWRWYNPRNGEFGIEGVTSGPEAFTAPDEQPWVLVIGKKG